VKTYYITFTGFPRAGQQTISWRVLNTENDLDTAPGLIDEIDRMERACGYRVVFTYWKELPYWENPEPPTDAQGE